MATTYPDGLEQACQRPGHWLIEGHKVHRVRSYGRGGTTFWKVYDGSGPGATLIAQVEYLNEARELIAERIGR